MTAGQGADTGVTWVRVAKGVYLLGLGTFLLLCTQGVLPWSLWRDALAYWPVLLVAIGIRLIFERSGAALIVLLGPLLVLGTLMYVAMRGPGAWEARAEWERLRVDRPAGTERWTLEGRLALTSLDFAARPLPPGVLLEGRAAPPGRASLRIAEGGDAGRVQVTNGRRLRWLVVPSWGTKQACELRLSQALPLALDLEVALTGGTIDLAAVPVSRVSLQGAFNDLALRLGPPTEDVRLEFEGAFNDVELRVPATTPVRVDTEGLVNVVDGRAGATTLGGPGYRLLLHGAFNRVVVEAG
jgi:hypothetical protein